MKERVGTRYGQKNEIHKKTKKESERNREEISKGNEKEKRDSKEIKR